MINILLKKIYLPPTVLEIVDDLAPNLQIYDEDSDIKTGNTWIRIQGFKLDMDGIFYIVLVDFGDPKPTYTQILNGLNANSSEAIQSIRVVKKKALDHSFSFKGLESGKAYQIYYFVSNDLPLEYYTPIT